MLAASPAEESLATLQSGASLAMSAHLIQQLASRRRGSWVPSTLPPGCRILLHPHSTNAVEPPLSSFSPPETACLFSWICEVNQLRGDRQKWWGRGGLLSCCRGLGLFPCGPEIADISGLFTISFTFTAAGDSIHCTDAWGRGKVLQVLLFPYS